MPEQLGFGFAGEPPAKSSVSRDALEALRARYGIRVRFWPSEWGTMCAFAGRVPDDELATALGLTPGTVAMHRRMTVGE